MNAFILLMCNAKHDIGMCFWVGPYGPSKGQRLPRAHNLQNHGFSTYSVTTTAEFFIHCKIHVHVSRLNAFDESL